MVKAQGGPKGGKAKKRGPQCKEKKAMAQKKTKKLEKKRKTEASRHRKKIFKTSSRDSLDCCVLLTRLDAAKVKEASKLGRNKGAKSKTPATKPRTKPDQSRPTPQAKQKAPEPKTHRSNALRVFSTTEPRRRRMASLNAEAVNALLLFRNDPLSLARKQQQPPNHEDNPREPGHRRTVRQKAKKSESVDWLSLFAPTPRRQAGLTAATLLKLTSHQYTSKRQKKKEVQEAAAPKKADSEAKSGNRQPAKTKTGQDGPEWSPEERLEQSLGFSLKVKEEPVESQVSSCYCCTQERCVQYCHRLALFLRDKSCKEPDGALSSVFHHHHHHHHLPPLGTHSYTCFPGYYVHFSHPAEAPRDPVCPRSRKRAKLLGARSEGPAVYCCTSVEPCCDPCSLSGYQAYTSVIPAISHADCSQCSHALKKEEYSPALSDPPSLPICPSPRVLTGCPVPPVPPAGQSLPGVQAPAPQPSRPATPARAGRECPQSDKPPGGSRAGTGDSGAIRDKKHALSAPTGGRSALKKWRHRNTNGWRPVGQPFQREVFSVDEESPVLRTCFEAVQRDGDVIRVRDTVLLRSGPRKKSLPYVAKVSALWEEPESEELMMSLFWYYRPEHTQGGRNPSIHCENEVFASRHQDVNSVACIEDKCYVLTLAQYCRFCALVKRHREGVGHSTASAVVPPAPEHALPTHHCVPPDVDPQLVFFCRHVYDFRYGRLLKNLQ